MTARPLPPELSQLVLDRTAPLIIVDVDEVLAMFMLGFERFVGRYGLEMRITRFALFENVYRPGEALPIEAELGKWLFEAFFDTDGEDIDPAFGAADALDALSSQASIVILTNAPGKSRDARSRWLARHGFPYPMVMNNGPKGAAVRALADLTEGPVAFVDDLLPNLESAAMAAPQTHRFQMVADERLRPFAYSDTERHRRIDHWPEMRHAIAETLNIARASG